MWTKKGTKTLLLGLGNDWKGTIRPEAYFIISSIRNIIGQEGTFMDEKVTTLLLGMIKKERKGMKLKVEGTLLGNIWNIMDEKGPKTLCKEWLKRNKTAARPIRNLIHYS